MGCSGIGGLGGAGPFTYGTFFNSMDGAASPHPMAADPYGGYRRDFGSDDFPTDYSSDDVVAFRKLTLNQMPHIIYTNSAQIGRSAHEDHS